MDGQCKTPKRKTPRKLRRRVDGSPIVPRNPNLPAKRIFLIRHAESMGQAARTNGWDRKTDCRLLDCGLTAKGESQAQGLRKLFSREDIESIQLVVSSPLTRALQTSLLAFPEKDTLVGYQLREIGSKVPENQPRRIEDVLKDLTFLLANRPNTATLHHKTLQPADWPRDYSPSVVKRDRLRELFQFLYHERTEIVFAIVCHYNVIRSVVTDGSSLRPANAVPLTCDLYSNGEVVVSRHHHEKTLVEHDTRTTQNEYSTAASYYSFFNKFKRDQNEKLVVTVPEKEVSLSQDFWIEDVWTTLDEAAAEQLLTAHIEKCSIASTSFQKPAEYEDATAWDQFYSHHGNRFFKDRHYLQKAFPDEFSDTAEKGSKPITNDPVTLVEIGCGVGNAILPLMEPKNGRWDVIHGLDISQQAVQLLKNDSRFVSFNERGALQTPKRAIFGHACDVSKALPPLLEGVSDVTTLLFCLSAIDPLMMPEAIRNVASTLKPGGRLVFRDYGRYDEAQMKLGTSRSKRIKENFYQKHDGTKCYYFTVEEVNQMFGSIGGLDIVEVKYLRRVYENKATGLRRRRVWVQGRFQKPL